LIIVGTGKKEYVDSLEKLVNNLEIKDIVTFAGFNSNPSRIISAFDLMIAPSNQEPFGRTLVEAMIQKTFVLAARGGGHSEIIDNEVTGRLYNHNDTSSFISKCNMCIDDNESKYRMINKANTVAILKYSSHEHAKNIINIYHKLLFS
jgi:glycosyltransferase involved in cell wall biosynthesis